MHASEEDSYLLFDAWIVNQELLLLPLNSCLLLFRVHPQWPERVCVCERVWLRGSALPIPSLASLGRAQIPKVWETAAME